MIKSKAVTSTDSRQVVTSITAGLVVGLIVIVFSISLASLIFSGELGMYLKNERTANVVTAQKSVLYQLSVESMKNMEAQDPDVASALHEWIARLLAERRRITIVR